MREQLQPTASELNSSLFFSVLKAARLWSVGIALTAALPLWALPALADVPTRDDPRLQPNAETTKDTGQTEASSKERSASTGGLKCSVARQDMTEILNGAADRHGLPRQYLENAAVVESRCNPNAGAKASSAKGLGQFINSTWRAYGNGQDVYDPAANADAMARLAKNDVARLQRKLGRSPTFEEGYLAHQQGIGGASCLISNPSAPATTCVSAAAVTGNGGNLGMTSGQFSSLVQGYYNSGSLAGARRAVATYDATGAMPNSGNFASGSNGSQPAPGTGPIAASNLPPLQRTTPRTARVSDARATSEAATGYAGDSRATQGANLGLLRQRSLTIGGGERTQDAMDINSRLRADHVQLGQEAIDAIGVWGSLVTSSLISDVSRQSSASLAMASAGGPAKTRPGDVMPGIPSPAPSGGVCAVPSATGQTCAARLADHPLNVTAYLATVAERSPPEDADSAAKARAAAALASPPLRPPGPPARSTDP